jgi:anti-sigma B factor antagonist
MVKPLRLSSHEHDGTVTVSVVGELDAATNAEFEVLLDEILVTRPGQLILQLSGVAFIDAGGLGTLVALKTRADRQHTALLLAAVPASMLRLMELIKLDRRFDFLPLTAVSGVAADQQSADRPAITRRRGLIRSRGSAGRPGPGGGRRPTGAGSAC